MKKAFTLIELLTVICILGIFSIVLFRTYKTISDISFRVEQQKTVNEEFLFVSEILQNFANRNSVDFEKYNESLASTKWFTNILYLSWEDWNLEIYSSGDCVEFSQTPDFSNLQSWCSLFLKTWDEANPIMLTSDSVYFSQAKFKIIPYSDSYFESAECETNYFACINDDWFWLFVDIYPKRYTEDFWANDIHLLVQHFFNI